MGWDLDHTHYTPDYRVVEKFGGFEPQISIWRDREIWVALTARGYIADQDIWSAGSSGETYVHVILPIREDACRAILRAKIVNEQQTMKAVT